MMSDTPNHGYFHFFLGALLAIVPFIIFCLIIFIVDYLF